MDEVFGTHKTATAASPPHQPLGGTGAVLLRQQPIRAEYRIDRKSVPDEYHIAACPPHAATERRRSPPNRISEPHTIRPFKTQREAPAVPAVQAIYDAMQASHRSGVMGDLNHRLLDEACRAARAELGAWDHRVLLWLSGYEPETCAVIAGLITRAHAAGRPAQRDQP